MFLCNLILNFQSPTPVPHVKENNDICQSNTNRVDKKGNKSIY